MTPLLVSLCLVGQPAATHEAANPLFKELLDPGLLVGPNLRAKFPPPTMPDGLDAAGQKGVITRTIGTDYSYDEFTRKSVVAPQLLKLRDVAPRAPRHRSPPDRRVTRGGSVAAAAVRSSARSERPSSGPRGRRPGTPRPTRPPEPGRPCGTLVRVRGTTAVDVFASSAPVRQPGGRR